MADGVKAAELLVNVFDEAPHAAAPAEANERWRPERAPSPIRMVGQALAALGRSLLGAPALLARTLRGFRAVARRRCSGAVSPPMPFSAPKTAFNTALTPHRLYVSTSLSLDEVKAVKAALDATVNDVVLAVCAGALRTYLDGRGELPTRPLVAGVPVSTRTEDKGTLANSVSNLFTTVPIHLDDPVARVRHVHDVTKGAKEQLNLLGAEMLADWSELTPPRPYAAFNRLYSRFRLAERHRPPINLVISNVPGPPRPLYVAGAKLLSIYSMGPILENIGLNITVWSYLDQMNFGIVACRETLPDLRVLATSLHDALAELHKAADTRA
jgi:diacylglycerol O-acyltransferase